MLVNRLGRALCGATLSLGLVLSASRARASTEWLRITASPHCSPNSAAIAARIEQEVAGTRDPEVAVAVTLRESARGTTASIELTRGDEPLGAKELTAPSCEETVDAVLAVVALALSREPPAVAPVSDTSQHGRGDRRVVDSFTRVTASEPERDASLGEAPPPKRSFRVLVAAGVDIGTLSESTAMASAGAALRLERAEIRATVGYGVPSYRDEAGASVESRRTDFAAITLDYCRDFTHARSIAVCGGIASTLARISRTETLANESRREETRFRGTSGASLGLALVSRTPALQPRLELAAVLPVIGVRTEGSMVALRASIGASLPF